MYFIFEIFLRSKRDYIAIILQALAQKSNLAIELQYTQNRLILITKSDDEKLENYLVELESALPASIYMESSKHTISDEKPEFPIYEMDNLPLDISLCPSCQKEMFDVSSRRYYYPFTSCHACGSQHAFLDTYPYSRENSTLKFLVPCESCKEEMTKNPLRKNFPLISCIECGIALKMVDKKFQRYANDKGSYRQLFEVAARAIAKGKTILFQTTHGYRRFFKPTCEHDLKNSILMMADASKLNTHLMMVPQEFNALLSIERPLLRVATKSEDMKSLYGSSVWCKYPDDGMSMLLAKELITAGESFVAYEECNEDSQADMRVSFDIPVTTQKDFKLFINQDVKLLVSGERSIFPTKAKTYKSGRVVIANNLTSLEGVIDNSEHFGKIPAKEIYIKKGEPIEITLDGVVRFDGFKASMLSVLAEHEKLNENAIGVHFDSRLHFLYYNQKEVIDVVPPRAFESENLFEKIANLREGSDRLVQNFKTKFPTRYEKLDTLTGEIDIFTVVAMILGLEDESFDGISAQALSFLGKGGMLVDTKVKDNRFNDYAFLASIMSFKLSGAENPILCYSIYESFGDYIADIVTQLMEKTKAKNLTLTGTTFANQSLWGRIQKNLSYRKPLMNKSYPIGVENEVVGGGVM